MVLNPAISAGHQFLYPGAQLASIPLANAMAAGAVATASASYAFAGQNLQGHPDRPLHSNPAVRLFSEDGPERILPPRELPEWRHTHEGIKRTLLFVLEKYLDNDISRITSGTNFGVRYFELESGETIQGNTILRAVAKMRCPDKSCLEAMRSLGGPSGVIQLIKKDYLQEIRDGQDWYSTGERLERTFIYVIDKYLDGNVSVVNKGGFARRKYELDSGKVVSGAMLIDAAIRLEMPGISIKCACKALGGYTNVIRLIREKYLTSAYKSQLWHSTRENLRRTILFLSKQVDGGIARMTSGNFRSSTFTLPSGEEVSGDRILRAVAKMEMSGKSGAKAMEALGGYAETARVMRELYLAGQEIWNGDHRTFIKNLEYIVEKYLGGDPRKVSAKKGFRDARFALESGEVVSGYDVLVAVARLERPHMGIEDAKRSLGNLSGLAELIRNKYLFSLDETPESFIQAMKIMMGEDGDENGGDA